MGGVQTQFGSSAENISSPTLKPTPGTITMVKKADRCIEGLHMMHTYDAVLLRSAFGPVYLMPILHRRGQIRQVGAPNQLK